MNFFYNKYSDEFYNNDFHEITAKKNKQFHWLKNISNIIG